MISYSPSLYQRGFSLLELIIVMALSLVILGSTYRLLILQNKTYNTQEQIAEMQQNARAAMDMMVREIRMAGYDSHVPPANAGVVSATANSINFTLDLTRTFGPPWTPDGDTLDPNENVTYSLYNSNGIQTLGRKSQATAVIQPVAENVQTLSLRYWNADNVELSTPVADPSAIRKIQITLTFRTSKPDPNYSSNSGHRTYSLTSIVDPRNLSL